MEHLSIPLKFRNKKAILIATGPSLTEDVVELVRKYKDNFIIFGCNDSFKIVDFLDIHYACDDRWWNVNGEEFREKFPTLESWTQANSTICEKYSLKRLAGKHQKQLSINSDYIHFGANSGYQMLNLAFLMGCSEFLLVGYNMQIVNNKKHFFGDHPQGLNNSSPYPRFVDSFNSVQPEIKELIINCTTESALTMFKYMDLETALCK